MAKGKALIEEGQEAGRQTDQQGCVDQTVARYKRDSGFTGGISSGIFMESCLRASSPTPGFCDEVPHETEFIRSAKWQQEQCERAGLASDQYCRHLFQGVERFCDKQKP